MTNNRDYELRALPNIFFTGPPSSGKTTVVQKVIGKMECFSDAFCEVARKALDAPNIVLGTIAIGGTDFIRTIKERSDFKIYEVTPQNRDRLPDLLLEIISPVKS
jgi:nucleoside-triphosphatase THEP1